MHHATHQALLKGSSLMKVSLIEQARASALTPAQNDYELAADDVVSDESNGALLSCLDAIIGDDELLAAVARRSHRHQLGFLKYVLIADPSGRCLRMHYWDRVPDALEDIHSHCASFRSRIVLGELTENSFGVRPGAEHSRFRYRFDENLGHSVAVAHGMSGMSLLESLVLQAGDEYTKAPNELHSVSNVRLGTLTVSAWEERHSDALVFKSPDAAPEDCVVPVGVPLEQLRAELLEIRKRILSQ